MVCRAVAGGVGFPGASVRLALLAVLAALFTAGCGTGAYEQLMAQRLADVQRLAPFTELSPAVNLPGTRVKIRLPKRLTAAYKTDSPHPQDGPQIAPQRVQPPFLLMPGFQLCYEAFDRDQTQAKMPYYCYLYALPPNLGANLIAQVPILLKQQFPGQAPDPAWQDTTVVSESGASLAWKRIRVEGNQLFDVTPLNQPQGGFVPLPGIFELWLHEAPDYIVMVGWRIPSALEPNVQLLNLAPVTAATLTIDPAPAEAPAQPAAAPAPAG